MKSILKKLEALAAKKTLTMDEHLKAIDLIGQLHAAFDSKQIKDEEINK